MTDPLSLQKQLASRLNANFETSDQENLADKANIEPLELADANRDASEPETRVIDAEISPSAVIAFDELQKSLAKEQEDKKQEGKAPKKSSNAQKPIFTAIAMFAIMAMIISLEYYY